MVLANPTYFVCVCPLVPTQGSGSKEASKAILRATSMESELVQLQVCVCNICECVCI